MGEAKLREGDTAPDVKLKNQDGMTVSLSSFNSSFIVLYFYPKDNTPGCTLEATRFSQLKKEFDKANAVVLGVSPDSLKSHCNFIEKHSLTIHLLVDDHHALADRYGVWGKKTFMGKTYMGIHRSTFVIHRKKIVKAWYDVSVKGHVDEVLGFLFTFKEPKKN